MAKDKENLQKMRHSLAHILAHAVQDVYGEVKFGVGPVIENGFYYDFDLDQTISEDDLPKIEKRMREIIKQDFPFKGEEVDIKTARARTEKINQPYKTELIDDLAAKGTTDAKANTSSQGAETASFYTIGDFTDLCRGGHLDSTGQVGAFKLIRVSGAYWRGNEENPQMQRVYGLAFAAEEELKKHLEMLEEAKKRDHRKLGQELDLFTFSDLVGSGLPLYTPRGTVLIEELKNALKDISRDHDMQLVSIPHLAKIDLYKISGHADKFSEELFRVKSHYDQEFVIKPVNCPHHTQIYKARPRSYRELPIRYIEQTMQYRDEKPGQIGGLQRTRGFTVDDGHTFCRVDQIEQEVSIIIEIIKDFYKNLGLWGKHWVSLSVRENGVQDKYIGSAGDWDKAEKMLDQAAVKNELGAKRMEGEAAIYGPKLDFMFKDALGRETQLATVQLDFAMPKRFELEYTDESGEQQTPIMIHRAILGSFERFIMLLIEHFGGKFPIWLAPEQIRVITVNQESETASLAEKIAEEARRLGLRLSVDNSNESVGKKIRNAEVMKVPYTLVIGEREIQSGRVTPRVRQDLIVVDSHPELPVESFLKSVANEAKSRTLKTSM